ncbi:hypothetical protein PANA5342_2429 [Pantoea ananatis LMG 5342]|nr:hypothetical protein PANA5342_2429 [Pantoea ananatis LMG 5342]
MPLLTLYLPPCVSCRVVERARRIRLYSTALFKHFC